MNDPKNSDPAFPFSYEKTNQYGNTYPVIFPGMTLRDWFAGQALAGLNSNPSFDDTFQPKNFEFTAKTAYAQAEAMLSIRNPQKEID